MFSRNLSIVYLNINLSLTCHNAVVTLKVEIWGTQSYSYFCEGKTFSSHKYWTLGAKSAVVEVVLNLST